jgi:putative transposase
MRYETQTLSERLDGRAGGPAQAVVAASQPTRPAPQDRLAGGRQRSVLARPRGRFLAGFASRLPPWKTVYNYFQWWSWDGTWQKVRDALRPAVRVQAGRAPTSSAGALDSQAVKTAEGGQDGGKKVRGRKRHSLVDTLGLLLAVVVAAANVDDARAAQKVFEQARGRDYPRLEVGYADNRYRSTELDRWLRVHQRPDRSPVVSRAAGETRFVALPIRWVVERTFAGQGRYRRLSKDEEHWSESSETVVKIAAIHPMLRRLRPKRVTRRQRFPFQGHRPKQAAEQ